MNRVALSGYLYTEPSTEKREIGDKKYIFCEFGLAVQRDYHKEGKPTADYIWIRTLNKQAEFCQKFLSKGRKAIVEGSIKVDKWKDAKDKWVYRQYIEAQRIEVCDSKHIENELSDTGSYISSNIDVSGLEGADFQTESAGT